MPLVIMTIIMQMHIWLEQKEEKDSLVLCYLKKAMVSKKCKSPPEESKCTDDSHKKRKRTFVTLKMGYSHKWL